MLRSLFGEEPRRDEGTLKEAMVAIDRYLAHVRKQIDNGGDPGHYWRKIEIWTIGLRMSLDELEQSIYASGKYAERVTKHYRDDMNDKELDDYLRHVYFYKNAFIRVFSILDKLGTLLNEVLRLETEQMKRFFSYFTVLRRLHRTGRHPRLADKLSGLKQLHGEAMRRLRKRRNTEIHYMNAEMQDDLLQRHRSLNSKLRLEDIQSNMDDAEEGMQMVCGALTASFRALLDLEKGSGR